MSNLLAIAFICRLLGLVNRVEEERAFTCYKGFDVQRLRLGWFSFLFFSFPYVYGVGGARVSIPIYFIDNTIQNTTKVPLIILAWIKRDLPGNDVQERITFSPSIPLLLSPSFSGYARPSSLGC